MRVTVAGYRRWPFRYARVPVLVAQPAERPEQGGVILGFSAPRGPGAKAQLAVRHRTDDGGVPCAFIAPDGDAEAGAVGDMLPQRVEVE